MPKHKFDLKRLEQDLRQFYDTYLKEDNKDTRLALFYGIRDLGFAILTIKYDASNFDPEEIAYEYALYLYQRIIDKKFTPEISEAGFPWHFYINQNIKHILFSKIKEDSNTDNVEFNDEKHSELEDIIFKLENQQLKNIFEQKVKTVLENFYTKEEITRLYPLAVNELLYNRRGAIIPTGLPKDLEEFLITIIAVSKRIATDMNLNGKERSVSESVDKALRTSLRSTIFLSIVANEEKFPKGLFLNLDIDTLYRLVASLGGKTIRIPTEREMDTLIAAMVMIEEMISNGTSFDDALKEAKEKHQCILSNQINIRNLIKEVCTNILEDPKPTTPLLYTLKSTIDFLDDLFPKILKKVDENPEQYSLDIYMETTRSLSSLMGNLIELSNKMEKI